MSWGLLFRTKAALNHATLQAARSGMVANAQPAALVSGLARGLLPLFGPQPGVGGAATALVTDVLPEVVSFSRVRILNPTPAAFRDFAVTVDGVREIPNDELHRRSTAVGGNSGINIQDANLLRVEVVYGARLTIPLAGPLILATLQQFNSGFDEFELALLAAGRIPVASVATVRMQSPARESRLLGTSS